VSIPSLAPARGGFRFAQLWVPVVWFGLFAGCFWYWVGLNLQPGDYALGSELRWRGDPAARGGRG
jgi:hypothetical protein